MGEFLESVTSIIYEPRKLRDESSATSFSEGEGERAPVATRLLFSATSSEQSGQEVVKIFYRQGVLSRRSGGIHTLEVHGKNSGYFRSIRAEYPVHCRDKLSRFNDCFM